MVAMLISIAADTPPATPTVSIVIYLLGALLTGGVLKVVYDAYRRWQSGPLDDSETIGRTLRNELGAMKDLLEEYRIEQEVTKRQLDDYRGQLGEVTSKLAEARVRIENLETALDRARDRRDFMENELRILRKNFEMLTQQRDGLQREADSLRHRLAQLSNVTGVPPDEPAGGTAASGGGDIAP